MKVELMKVDIQKYMDRRDWVKYLIVPLWYSKERDSKYIEIREDDAFMGYVKDQVSDYLNGKAPVDEIESAVMNVADQYVAGEGIILHTGDYIAFQRQYRALGH